MLLSFFSWPNVTDWNFSGLREKKSVSVFSWIKIVFSFKATDSNLSVANWFGSLHETNMQQVWGIILFWLHAPTDSCSVAQLLQWTAVHQASPSFTVSWDLIKLMSIESIILLNPLILCCPLLLLLSVFPSIKITALYNSVKLWPIPRNLHWRREWQTTSAFVPREPHDQCEKTKRYDTMDWINYDSWWLGSLRLRSWQIRCMVRAHFLDYHFFAENSHGRKGKGDVLDCFYKGTNPLWGLCLLTDSLPKPHLEG